jgi:hypothetical protein
VIVAKVELLPRFPKFDDVLPELAPPAPTMIGIVWAGVTLYPVPVKKPPAPPPPEQYPPPEPPPATTR